MSKIFQSPGYKLSFNPKRKLGKKGKKMMMMNKTNHMCGYFFIYASCINKTKNYVKVFI